MISVCELLTQGKQYFSYLFISSFKYTGTCYYNLSCSLKWTSLSEIIFSNCGVNIYSCIILVCMFLQTSNNTFYPFT